MKYRLPIFLKLLRGPSIVMMLGVVAASMTASVDTVHGMDPEVLVFFCVVAAIYLLLNFLSGFRRCKA